MTFLPLASRELRVAARQPVTVRLRLLVALTAIVISAGFLILATLSSRTMFPMAVLGSGLFKVLTWQTFVVALMAGPFLTADCLSGEKREGTLGLLFLTDLRGDDVVFGKLASTSLRAGAAMLALLPVIASSLLLGGVSGEQFWKSALALGSTLAVSLAAGLLVSSVSRDAQRALGLTLVLLVTLVAGGPMLDSLAGTTASWMTNLLRQTSPANLLVNAQGTGSAPFWPGWLLNLAVAGSMIALSGRILPRVWQDRQTGRSGRTPWPGFRAPSRNLGLPSRHRQLLEENPAAWLVVRDCWIARIFWAMAIALAGSAALWRWFGDGEGAVSIGRIVWQVASGITVPLLYIGAATQAVRFLVESRRSGLLELLLATPMTGPAIVSGHWAAWKRLFAPPILIILLVNAAGSGVLMREQFNVMTPPVVLPAPAGTTNATGGAATNSGTVVLGTGSVTLSMSVTPGGPGGPGGPMATWGVIAIIAFGLVGSAVNLIALGWFGMWMGLTSRNFTGAALKTLLFVQVLPALGIGFLTAISIPLVFFATGMNRGAGPAAGFLTSSIAWMPVLVTGFHGLLSLLKDLAFIGWSRRQLTFGFRERALQFQGTPAVMPPPRLAPPQVR